MPLKVLIIGAGICGPAMATLLRRSDPGHSITVVERHPEIRHNGLQIDLRAWGIPIMQKLGLLEKVKQVAVKENGIAVIDSKGKISAVLGVNDSGSGAQSFTSQYEVMRGDLVNILYEASMKDADVPATGKGDGAPNPRDEDAPGIRYRFNITVTGMAQDEKGVDVTFTDSTTRRYDLVIGADGQWSKTRRVMFGEEVGNEVFKRLHVYVAYYTVKREPGEDELARWYQAGNGRSIVMILMLGTTSEEIRQEIERQPVEKQRATFERLFTGAGWEMEDRFLQGLRESTDFYVDSLGQVKAPHAVKGRIALLGDAGHCAGAITGMGTTVSLISAYTLAGELARHDGDVPIALKAYDTNVKPYITEAQKLMFGVPAIFTLKSSWAVVLVRFILWLITSIKFDKLIMKLVGENKGGLQLPDYPELKLVPVTQD
ncbi:FAD/NAD(P)-binding domain-containing protein [Hypoxylon sp. FL1150]|nr:FAD/NAD(P)-binding domain-containing protein [Hypoxylon sp. FL1150]